MARVFSRMRPSGRRRWMIVGMAALVIGLGLWRGIAGLVDDDVRSGDKAAHGARIVRYAFESRFVHRTMAQTAAVPSGASRVKRPLLVFLHGRGGDNEANSNDAFYRALRGLGTKAPIVVFPDGGDSSYWHARRSGDWARYVVGEVIPQAVRAFTLTAHVSRSAGSPWADTAPSTSRAGVRRSSALSADIRQRSGSGALTAHPGPSMTLRTTLATTSSR